MLCSNDDYRTPVTSFAVTAGAKPNLEACLILPAISMLYLIAPQSNHCKDVHRDG